jgi:hypothetical protein
VPRRIAVFVDPGKKSGLATWELGGFLLGMQLVRLDLAGVTQEHVIDKVDKMIGEDLWIAGLERQPNPKEGKRNAAVHGERYWLDVFDLLARRRCARAGVVFRRPTIERPLPHVWRGDLGIRTRWIGRTEEEQRADLKAAAVIRLKQKHNLEITQDDIAEAMNGAEWLAQRTHYRMRLIPPAGVKRKELRFAA